MRHQDTRIYSESMRLIEIAKDVPATAPPCASSDDALPGLTFDHPENPTRGSRAQRQAHFTELGKGKPHPLVRLLAWKQVFFEPHMTEESLGRYLETVAPNTIEFVAHNIFHVTLRVGCEWFDFHWNDENDPRNVRTITKLNLFELGSAVESVKSIIRYYGRRGERDLGIGVCISANADQIDRFGSALKARTMPVPYDPDAQNGGETCFSLLTGIMEESVPELGIRRTNDSGALFDLLMKKHPQAGLITIYSNSDYSHLRAPWHRLASLAAGAPRTEKMLRIWEKEFAMPVPGQPYVRTFYQDPTAEE